MSARKAMLLDRNAEWSGIVHESAGDARMDNIKADLGDTWFAWSGPTTGVAGKNGTAYHRIQGPRLVIEYAPHQMGGDPSMHIDKVQLQPNQNKARAARNQKIGCQPQPGLDVTAQNQAAGRATSHRSALSDSWWVLFPDRQYRAVPSPLGARPAARWNAHALRRQLHQLPRHRIDEFSSLVQRPPRSDKGQWSGCSEHDIGSEPPTPVQPRRTAQPERLALKACRTAPGLELRDSQR